MFRGFWGSSLIKPPFRVTSADVVIICPDIFSQEPINPPLPRQGTDSLRKGVGFDVGVSESLLDFFSKTTPPGVGNDMFFFKQRNPTEKMMMMMMMKKMMMIMMKDKHNMMMMKKKDDDDDDDDDDGGGDDDDDDDDDAFLNFIKVWFLSKQPQ